MAPQPFQKFYSFTEACAEKVHKLDTDALTIALSNTAPSNTNTVLTDIAQISYTNLNTGTRVVGTPTSSSQSGGTYKLVLPDVTFGTSSGSVGPFQYIILYNDTPTAPADPLIGWWDNGSAVTLTAGQSFSVDFDPATGVIQLGP